MLEPLLLKPEQVGELLGIGRSRVFQLIRRGELPSVKLGKFTRVPMAALRAWVAEHVNTDELEP